MRTEYAKYKDYKKANVKFIDVIPSHWEIWKVTHGYRKIGSGTTPKSDNPEFYSGDIPWITTSELRETIINDSAQKITEHALENVSSLKLYNPGSVAIAMYGATIGRLGILGIKSTVNQACCVFDNPENFHQKFLFYWLWMSRNTLIAFSAGGGQPNLSQDDLKQLRIPIPEIPEQTQIASFLDKKTAQIDKLINEKEKLLKLLAEKRTAIITQAVTKGLPAEERAKAGLDPNVEMKDSGIDWLGEIPKDWNAKKLKFLASYNDEKLNENEEPDLDINYVEIGNVNLIDGITYIEELKFEKAPSRARRIVREGDTIISTVRTYLKAIAFINKLVENLIVSTGFAVLRSKDTNVLNPKYLGYCAQDQRFVEKIVSKSVGVSYPAISPYGITEISIAFPDIKEQIRIVEFLDNSIAQQDKIQQRIQTSLYQLKEYREALITAAVTGQIDVRKEVINE